MLMELIKKSLKHISLIFRALEVPGPLLAAGTVKTATGPLEGYED